MSDRKLIYEVARDIQCGKITIDDAMATWGHIVDRDELLDVLDSLEIEIVDHEDGTITFRVPESWGWGERTWSEEDPVS
ncbi:MAG: hypothetical protein ACYDCF_08230 [Burkholderiales bacterium]